MKFQYCLLAWLFIAWVPRADCAPPETLAEALERAQQALDADQKETALSILWEARRTADAEPAQWKDWEALLKKVDIDGPKCVKAEASQAKNLRKVADGYTQAGLKKLAEDMERIAECFDPAPTPPKYGRGPLAPITAWFADAVADPKDPDWRLEDGIITTPKPGLFTRLWISDRAVKPPVRAHAEFHIPGKRGQIGLGFAADSTDNFVEVQVSVFDKGLTTFQITHHMRDETKYYMSFSGLWGDEKQEEWIPLDVELYDDLLVMRHHNTSHSIPVKPGSLAGNVAISLSGDPENSDALQVRNFDVQPMLARGGGMTLEGFESSVAQATADLETKKSREKALQRLWELRYQSASVTPVPDRKTLQQLGQLIDKNDPQESRRHQVMGSIAKMAAQQDAKDRKAGRNALADARMRWFAGLAPDLVGATVSGPVVEAAAPPPELTWTALDMDEVFKDLDKEGWVRSGDGVEAPAPKKELTDIWATSSVSVTGNVRITAQVQFEGSTGFGMHFGDKSSSDFRTLSINGFDNKSVTTSYFTGKWNPKKEGKIDINSVNHTVGLKEFHEGPVTVSVELIGNTVAVTVDGQPTQVYTLDSPLKPGPIGFFVLPYFGDEEEGPGTVRIPSLTIETAP